jgi:molybdenum cofactor cytidylyltransferase
MALYPEQAIIILAAGTSSRMGTSKQLLQIKGRTLLEHTVASALGSDIPNVLVVLGANAKAHLSVLKGPRLSTVINPDWAKGMGTSLKCGLKKSMEIFPGLDAVMLLVCDQPLLTSSHINSLSEAFLKSNSKAVASKYPGAYGVPAIFDKSLFSELQQIGDQSGAREVLKNLGSELEFLTFEGGDIDIDTPEDYKKFNETGIVQ